MKERCDSQLANPSRVWLMLSCKFDWISGLMRVLQLWRPELCSGWQIWQLCDEYDDKWWHQVKRGETMIKLKMHKNIDFRLHVKVALKARFVSISVIRFLSKTILLWTAWQGKHWNNMFSLIFVWIMGRHLILIQSENTQLWHCG